MTGEAITILLLLCIASICFVRQKKIFHLQATLPLSFMPLITLLMHAVIVHLPHASQHWNSLVYAFYGAAALLTVGWVAYICFRLAKPMQRAGYAIIVLGFSALLGILFLKANLIA